ncbi:MAG: UPF0261 family protein [Caldilineaceae bacterium SB0662_bin_9]|uniref:UPF0261 family protein n=1 Tax=Caldilineaceae bacterium SB0662_bin_9 TaxID=2605258 RepID=A0A6B1DWN6_9CHLR|nr:UPF0261 family protein [Caldilineaceae bacterium SB0662_bin_9]
MPTVAVLGTLDTKGVEVAFLKDQIERCGCDTLVVDLGIVGPPVFEPDLSRRTVAAAAGERIDALAAAGDRGRAVAAMTRGAEEVVPELHASGRVQAVIGIGGSAGTTMSTAAMRALPMGVPKLMVSTIAGGDVSGLVGLKDIVMIPSIVDVSGLNRISRHVFAQAAAAIAAMAQVDEVTAGDRPLVAASMFGNTTQCVEAARQRLEAAGFEVLVFHATGTGGRTMEDLVASGFIAGVLDVTTTELADELAGGVMSAGPHRLGAAARAGIPAVVAPGCLDMVNFWTPDSIPETYRGRRFYRHNPNVTLMRTTPAENLELGRRLAERVNSSSGPVAVYLPLKGISVVSAPGQPFAWLAADESLFRAIRETLRPDIPLYEMDLDINDPAFAEAVADGLLQFLGCARGPARN